MPRAPKCFLCGRKMRGPKMASKATIDMVKSMAEFINCFDSMLEFMQTHGRWECKGPHRGAGSVTKFTKVKPTKKDK